MPNRLIQAARAIAIEKGLLCVTREAIAARVGVSTTQVSRLGGGLESILSAALAQALNSKDYPYLARVLQTGYPLDEDLAEKVRRSFPTLSDPLDCPPYGRIWRSSYELARDKGFPSATREAIADRAGVCKSLVSYAYGSLDAMPGRMIACGIAAWDAKMVARGLQIEHPAAKAAPATLRAEAAAILAE
jgi:AcrR family transcriptional regulator